MSAQTRTDSRVVSIPLEANGQEALYIEGMFTGTDTSDFVGSVRRRAQTRAVEEEVVVVVETARARRCRARPQT